MTNLGGGPTSASSPAGNAEPRRAERGRRRRQDLVDAGVALLSEGGWAAITTRAVAQRAGANPGLVHYHFGSLDDLRHAASAQAVDLAIGGVADRLLQSADPDETALVLEELLGELGAGAGARLTVELLHAATVDPHVRAQVADALRRVRALLAERLAAADPGVRRAVRQDATLVDATLVDATLLVAALDGLLLHHIVDPGLDVTAAVTRLAPLLAGGAGPP